MVNLSSWDDMLDGREWAWWSIWPLERVISFREIRIVGNAFSTSQTRSVIRHWFGTSGELEFEQFELPKATSVRKSRNAIVHYFTDVPGTTKIWTQTDFGRQCLLQIAAWIISNAPRHELLWSANSQVADILAAAGISGIRERPLLAGINQYRHVTWAALIYSAKLQKSEQIALQLFEPNATEIQRSREYEALLQFAFRTSLRENDFAGTVHIIVYDRGQADFLVNFLHEHALAEATFSYENIGISGIATQAKTTKAGPKPLVVPRGLPQTAAERKRAERARRAASQANTGATTARARGRPRNPT